MHILWALKIKLNKQMYLCLCVSSVFLLLGYYHHHGPDWLTFRSFAAASISHPPFTHSVTPPFSQSVSQSLNHSAIQSVIPVFALIQLPFPSFVHFSLGVLGVKVTPLLDSDYELHSGFQMG